MEYVIFRNFVQAGSSRYPLHRKRWHTVSPMLGFGRSAPIRPMPSRFNWGQPAAACRIGSCRTAASTGCAAIVPAADAA